MPSACAGDLANLWPAQYVGSRTAINVLLTSPYFVGEAVMQPVRSLEPGALPDDRPTRVRNHSRRGVNLMVESEVHRTSSQENPIGIVGTLWVIIDQLSEMKA